MHAQIRGTTIYFDVEGAGLVPDGGAMRQKPEAMVIHGGPGGDHSGFKPAFTPLAETMQLVYFDHRGQGRSARGDPDRYTLDENVEDMEALRRYLGLAPIVSIGTSYGGMVAMAHAARYPHAVSRLVLVVTGRAVRLHHSGAGDRGGARHAGAESGVRHVVGRRVPDARGAAALLCGDGADVLAQIRPFHRGGDPRPGHAVTGATEPCLRARRLPAPARSPT